MSSYLQYALQFWQHLGLYREQSLFIYGEYNKVLVWQKFNN